MIRCDAAIVGGGPAGAALAGLLAAWGHDVVLIARPAGRHPLAESIPPSCIKLFDRIGIRDAVDRAGWLRAGGNTVHWAGATERVENFPQGTFGYQVPRAEFDALLLGAAAAAGARVVDDAAVRAVERSRDGTNVVRYDTAGGTRELEARWVADCSGRSGVVARHGWRRPEAAGRTTALAGLWERIEGWGSLIPDASHTVVESYDGGWAWSVPISATRRFFTVMVDPEVTSLPGAGHLQAAYRAELARTERLARLLDDASLAEPAFARDASPYSANRVGEPGVLLVGDAASFVDPLSSFGIKKAMASAWLAAVVMNSAFAAPELTDAAVELFSSRERAIYDHLRRQAAALSREASVAYASDFWLGRSATDEDEASGDEIDVAALRADPRVLAALAELKRRSVLQLRTAPGFRVVPRAIVRGNRVVLEEHLSIPGLGDRVRYLRSIDLLLVCELARECEQVPELFEAYNRRAAPAPLPDFLGALSVLIGFDALVFA